MTVTTDREHPGINKPKGGDPMAQNEAYIVLSEEERAKGFVRPLRDSYIHVGPCGPLHELRDLTPEQFERYSDYGYVKFEKYPDDVPSLGQFWTQEQLDAVDKGCKSLTTMAGPIAETYACEPKYYGSTFCVSCGGHHPVTEFVWDGTDQRVGS